MPYREGLGRLIAAGALAAASVSWGVARAADDVPPAWEHVIEYLREQRDRMVADLERSHAVLLERARETGNQDLVERLSPTPPEPRPRGYGVLPGILEDRDPLDVEPRQQLYSIETLSDRFARDVRDAAMLAGRTTSEPNLVLEPWVDEFERLRSRMRNVEEHIAYHAKWQFELPRYRAYYAGRNSIIDQVRTMQQLTREGQDLERAAELRRDVLDRVAPFARTPGMGIVEGPDGARILPVHVLTDIEDDGFLDVFRDAVRREWSECPPARELGLQIDLRLERVPASRLYPQGVPERGTQIDVGSHTARFPAGALVLTTGAASTYAMTGKAVVVGPSPLSPRTLAHEFGHLLGFGDAYLRGFDGDSRSAFGAVIVEWTGLSGDLMANPGRGKVTEEMIRTLLEVYGGG